MKKVEFLVKLREALEALPSEEQIRSVAFYEEVLDDRIEDGMDEEEAVAALGTVEDIARRILEEVPGTLSIPKKSDGYDRYEKKQYDTNNDKVRGVRIFTKNCPVNIEVSPDRDIHVYYTDTEWEHYEIQCTDGLLEIRAVPTGDFFNRLWSMFHWKERTLTVELPGSFVGGAYVETTNGAFYVRGVTFGGRLELHTTNGAVKLESTQAPGIYARTSNGVIRLLRVTSASIMANTSNGAVMFDRISSPDIFVETSNGAVKGSVLGGMSEYRIESRTSNGKSNLPSRKSDGAKSLKAITSNGVITVDFIPDND